MSDVYYEPVPYDWQLEQDRLDRLWETGDRPDLYPPSPTPAAAPSPADSRCVEARTSQPVVVDVEFLSRLGWLPAPKVKE